MAARRPYRSRRCPLPLVLVALVKMGVPSTAYMVTSNALTQFATPSQQHGCVVGFHSYSFFGTTMPGALLAGWLSQIGDTTLAFAVAGVVDAIV